MRRLALLFIALAACRPIPNERGPYARFAEKNETLPQADVSQVEWTLSRERLARVREGKAQRPYVERLRLAIVDGYGRHFEARAVLAVAPEVAARLVLLDPSGNSVLDVWATPDRYRCAIQGVGLRRGGREVEAVGDLPIALLRWWFITPLDGRLLLGRSTDEIASWLLRDRGATTTVRTDGSVFFALHREGEALDGLVWKGPGLAPARGAHGRYVAGHTGLVIDIAVEDVRPEEPDPETFYDPDEHARTL